MLLIVEIRLLVGYLKEIIAAISAHLDNQDNQFKIQVVIP